MAVEQLLSLAEIFFACFLFGSLFVPIKRFNPGDGLFAQFLMCLTIFFVGLVAFAWDNFEHFYPLAMLGGASWCLGNLMAIPIINELGLGLSLLLFSITNCLTNFVVGTFGPFRVESKAGGDFLVKLHGNGFSFDRPSTHSMETYIAQHEAQMEFCESNQKTKQWRRLAAIAFALLSGILYGFLQVPIIGMQDHPEIFTNAPQSGLPYCFAHFTGILITSTLAFVVYSVYKKNKPSLNPEIVLPSLLAGVMWGVAMTITIVCTEHLSQAITGPITAMLPGCIATIWSVFYFQEIQMGRNLVLLWSAIGVSVVGAICIGLSKLDL
ncbi:hypothetical protein M3Y97_01005300 [Aphelenchoides bicaudatus]|nr:hypothetical protein M3Y97_01005300 [Aphelenchoides bicaudatus]